MKDQFKHSDAFLREKIDEHRLTPPEGAWDAIADSLPNKRRRTILFFVTLSIFVVSTIGLTIILNTSNASSVANPELANNSTTSHNSNTSEISKEEKAATFSDQKQTSIDGTGEQSSELSTAAKLRNDDYDSPETNTVSAASDTGSPKIASGVTKDTDDSDVALDSFSTPSETDSSGVATAADAGRPKDEIDHAEPYHIVTSATPLSEVLESTETPSRLDVLGSSNFEFEKPNVIIAPKVQPVQLQAPRGNLYLEAQAGVQFGGTNPYGLTSDSLASYLDSTISNTPSATGYLGLSYEFNNHISLSTGLSIASFKSNSTGYETFDNSYWSTDTTGFYYDTILQQQVPIIDSVYINSTGTNTTVSNNTSTVLSIPLSIGYMFAINPKNEFGVRLGGTFNYRLKTSGLTSVGLNGELIEISQAYKRHWLFGHLTLIYSYALNQRMKLYVSPTFNYGFSNSSTPSLPYNTRVNSAAVNVGIRFKL